MFEITRGPIAKAQKVVIYGPEGIGKSTLAAQFPNPVFIDTEDGTNNMDVARLPKPTSWTMLYQEIDDALAQKVGTLIIDTMDWAERSAIEYLCQTNNKKSIEDFGYGSGYIKLEEEIGRFLNKLQDLVDAGINIVLTAHSQIVKFEQPDEMGAYDRYTLKLGKKTQAKTSALVKEWADMVLFCNYEIFAVKNDTNKTKATGGKRVIHTTHAPAWDAKNRFGLPDTIDMDYKNIAHIFDKPITPQTPPPVVEPTPMAEPMKEPAPVVEEPQNTASLDAQVSPEQTEEVPKALQDLMAPDNVTIDEIKQAVAQKGYYPATTPIENYDEQFIQGVLVGAWDAVHTMILENRGK